MTTQLTDKHRCEYIIRNPPLRDHQCERNGTRLIDVWGYDEWYCKQHDPDEIMEREAEKNH